MTWLKAIEIIGLNEFFLGKTSMAKNFQMLFRGDVEGGGED